MVVCSMECICICIKCKGLHEEGQCDLASNH